MESLLLLFTLAFGAIIGSFLNVVALRFNTGKSINGRSACFVCRQPLQWYELVPVFSFIFLKGKCKTCEAKISAQYPLVEASTAFIFALIAVTETSWFSVVNQLVLFNLFFYWIIASILTVIAIYDFKHKIIPDSLSFVFAALSLIRLFVLYGSQLFHMPLLLDLLAGPILFVPFYLLWVVSKGAWMGLGDAKLAVGIGFLLGLAQGISAVISAFWIGSAVMILVIVAQHIHHHFKRLIHKKTPAHDLTLKSEIPFAPFLIVGILVAYLFHLDIMSVNLLLQL